MTFLGGGMDFFHDTSRAGPVRLDGNFDASAGAMNMLMAREER
jgi:hypothetical protein